MKKVYNVKAPLPYEYTEDALKEIRQDMYRKITDAFAPGWYRGLADAPNGDDNAAPQQFPSGACGWNDYQHVRSINPKGRNCDSLQVRASLAYNFEVEISDLSEVPHRNIKKEVRCNLGA